MRKGWLDTTKVSMGTVLQEFKTRYPLCNHEKLNISTMRQVLAGELVPVKMGGRQVYELWPGQAIRERLKAWNLRVAVVCHPIPPLPGKQDRTIEVLGLAKQLLITEHLELVGEGSPRKFAEGR